MKKKMALILSVLALALVPINSWACEGDTSGETESDCVLTTSEPEEDKTTSTDRFQANDNIKKSEKFDSSVFFAGNSITDDSDVKGVGLMAGNTLDISGKYEIGLHAGNVINIDGEYKNDLFVAGNIVSLKKNAKINHDAYFAVNKIDILTNISGDTFIAARDIYLANATIGGDLRVSAENITFGENVVVEGTFVHNSDAKITGEAKIAETETYDRVVVDSFRAQIVFTFASLASRILVMVLFMYLGKKFFASLNESIKNYEFMDGLKDTGKGVLVTVGVALVAALLVTFIFSIPAVLVIAGVLLICLYLSNIVTAAFIGNKLLRSKNEMINCAVGLVTLAIIGLIPSVGVVVGFFATMFGFGLMIRVLFKK